MRGSGKGRKMKGFFLLIGLLISGGLLLIGAFFFLPSQKIPLERGWRVVTQEIQQTLGLKPRYEVPSEEKRIREEIILKKMDEASAQQDWRSLAPEYPKPKKIEGATEEERMRALRNTTEFQALEKELKDYLRKKEDQLLPDPPIPSMKEASKIPKVKDGGEEKVIEKLMAVKERPSLERPLEENLRLGIRGALVSRKILERPPPPQVKVKVEAEVEMTLWVLPNGMVDRVLPTLKGDGELERIAIQYLKQWRFDPLPKDQPQVEQSGTIPLKFKLQ